MKRQRNAPTLDGLVLRKSDVRRVHAWAKKFIRTIERAHKRAGRSTLVFKSQNSIVLTPGNNTDVIAQTERK